MSKGLTKTLIAVGAFIVLFAIVFGIIFASRNAGKSDRVVSYEDTEKQLTRMYNSIDPIMGTPTKGMVSYTGEDTTYNELPDLEDKSIAVPATTTFYVEIFASSEKTSSGTDGYLREMVTAYNATNPKLADGTPFSVQLRTVASGQQVDYVTSGKYVPDAVSPSSTMQIRMINARGVDTEYIDESLVMNYAGIVVSPETYSTLIETYGEASVKSLAKATAEGKVIMGYTDPFSSATGLNFLVTLLDSYDSGNISSDTAIAGFKAFQANVPYVAMTTGQMKNAAIEKGTFGAFVSEYQAFVNDENLSRNYKFIPFGYEHENPLAAISSISTEKKEALKLFAAYCDTNGKNLAKQDGFNQTPAGYTPMTTQYSGLEIIGAQKLFKKNKDTKPVICVFVADVSGSMDGEPISALKNSLVNSMQYINEDNYVGLVSYSDNVKIELPIGQFNLEQQSLFKGTVESLSAGGGTATCDGVVVAMNMINEYKKTVPDARAIIFVLSDGFQNRGHSLGQIDDIVAGLQVPIYTICYNDGDANSLKQLSEINEGVTINATSDDVAYQLKKIFNVNT